MIYAYSRRGDRDFARPIMDCEIEAAAAAMIRYMRTQASLQASGLPVAPGSRPPLNPVTGAIQQSAASLAALIDRSIERTEAIAHVMASNGLVHTETRDLVINGFMVSRNNLYIEMPNDPDDAAHLNAIAQNHVRRSRKTASVDLSIAAL